MRTPPHVMVALITPFDEPGDIDFRAHRHNLVTLRSRGIEGFLIGGSTGEGAYLEPGERSLLVGAARDELGDDAFLMTGINAESIRQALRQATEAAESGADALLALTPTTMIRGRDQAVAGFFEQVATAADLPLLMYTFPRVTGYELPVETAIELAGHAGIAGIKDSGGNPTRLQQVVAAAPESFRAFAGASAALTLSIAAGAYGSITASANYAPSLVRDLVGTARRSPKRASDLQERLSGLTRVVEARGVPGVKMAAEVSGLNPGNTRAPLPPLPETEAATLRRSLAALRRQLLG